MPSSDFRPDPDAQWAALLHQLRQQPKAQPRPFFYARVQARLAAQAGAAGAGPLAWLRRPAYAALLAALVMAVSGDGSVAATGHSNQAGSYPTPYAPR